MPECHPLNDRLPLNAAQVRAIIFSQLRKIVRSGCNAPLHVLEDKAEDLCTLLPPRYDPTRGASGKTFLTRQAYFRLSNTARDHPSGRYGVISLDAAPFLCFVEGGEKGWEARVERDVLLQRLLSEIPVTYRRAVVSRYLDGETRKECSRNWHHLEQGMKMLREAARGMGLL